MSAEIEPNQKRKIALLTEAYGIITKLVEPLTSVVPVTPDTGNTKEKPILDAKSRSATPSEKHESPGLKTLENWVGYEWPQVAKDMFANTTNLSIFCKLSITNPRQLLSCLFYMVSQFEEFGQLQQCVPLLAITNLVTTMCIDSKQPQFMQSAVQLYTAIIYSKLFYVELAAKFRKLYQSSENGIDYLAPFWNDSNSGCDIGFSLSTESIILLKANLLIQYGDVLRANNLLIQWIPAFSKNSEALYVSSLLSWISNGDEGIMDLFKVENLKQAILFTKLIHRLVCKSGSQYPQKSTNNVLALITKSMELVQKNPRLELMLWQVKYKLLTAYYEENSSMQIEESFSACVKLTSSMDLCMQGAETLFWHAKFIRQKSSKLQGRDLAKNLLLCFDYLEECQELCETMKMVEKTQSWFLMGYNVALESAALLFQISQEGDLIDYSHRTIEVMIEEHFIPEGETSLSERWIEVQEDAIGKVITNLTRIIASLPQNLQIEGRRILGLCHKIQYQRLMGENLEQASEHLRICQLQFTRALKLAVQNGNINVARDCTEELLSHGTNSDEFSRLAHLSLLQSCHYWSYLSKLFEELNPQPKSELFLGTVNEAHQRQTMALQHNQAYKRVQPFHITPELLSDIPKNVKVLILQHSSDKSCLFGALVYRIKDGKSKSPLEDFSISNIHFPVEIQRINLMIERVKMLLASIGVGAVPDTQIVEDIYQYLQPILKLLEIEPSAKSTEKADSKKKGAKTVSTEPEEIDRGHCVICCDPILELLPLDIVLRVKNLATTTSFEFGLPYLLTRIKFNPGYSSEPVSAEKPAKKGKGGGADAAASSDKFEISTIKAFSSCDLPEDFFGSQLPGTLKFEHQTGVMNANEISTGIEGSTAGILIDKGLSLDPVSVARIASPPNIIVSLTEIEGEQGQRLLDQAKLLAGYNYLNGIGITMATSLPSTLTQSQAFARHFIKSKDAIKLRGEMSSEDIVNKRTLFGAYFIRTYGFL
ncbi:hypothetical protein BCR33DRAFT_788378 [Rhizoclosmatium globosum]|uniref:Uncharacterized protein n=1 Tax=Rhizoclosmatium globosum TaxID=329046 RepID=A0A1Y2BX73_9FUNG|nr:hypothetical protein BCR33DRAFT_788378 [Rhizoclosmatium globosum]|eukprot:ORY39369.1 hypothetical protein BCR33DRAFT_788378 [Rhizoclosmatium globosum]